jgi:hypothetical protein
VVCEPIVHTFTVCTKIHTTKVCILVYTTCKVLNLSLSFSSDEDETPVGVEVGLLVVQLLTVLMSILVYVMLLVG